MTIVSNNIPGHARWLLVDRCVQIIWFHSDRQTWRLNHLDDLVIIDRVEDGVEYLMILDQIPSRSNTGTLTIRMYSEISVLLDDDFIDFNTTSFTGA